jgi:hypothetical protein
VDEGTLVGFHVNLDYHSPGGGMSWHEWEKKLEERAARCASARVPEKIAKALWGDMSAWVEREFFSGRAKPVDQLLYYFDHNVGMYGKGNAPAPDHIINAWENLCQAQITKLMIQKDPSNAPVFSKQGPPFLLSMKQIGPVVSSGGGTCSVQVQTAATMTPYSKAAGDTKPIMYYLKHGWCGGRREMRPRWPNGLAPYARLAQPYRPHLKAIADWIING